MSVPDYSGIIQSWKNKFGIDGEPKSISLPQGVVDATAGAKLLGNYYKDQYNDWIKGVNQTEFYDESGSIPTYRKKYQLIQPSDQGLGYTSGGYFNPSVKYTGDYRNYLSENMPTKLGEFSNTFQDMFGNDSFWNENTTVSIAGAEHTGSRRQLLEKFIGSQFSKDNIRSGSDVYGTEYIGMAKDKIFSFINDDLEYNYEGNVDFSSMNRNTPEYKILKSLTGNDKDNMYRVMDHYLGEYDGPDSPMEYGPVKNVMQIMDKVGGLNDAISIAVLLGSKNKHARKWAKGNLSAMGAQMLMSLFKPTAPLANLFQGGKIGKTLLNLLKF